MIDTLDMYKKLKAAGIKPKHAEAITRAIALAQKRTMTKMVCSPQTDFS
jgi:hypothetical protein